MLFKLLFKKWLMYQLLAIKLLILGVSFLVMKYILVKYGDQALLNFGELKRYSSYLVVFMLLGYGIMVPIYALKKLIAVEQLIYSVYLAILGLIVFSAAYIFFSGSIFLSLYLFYIYYASIQLTLLKALDKLLLGAILNFINLALIPILAVLVSNTYHQFLIVLGAYSVLAAVALTIFFNPIGRFNFDKKFFFTSINRVPADAIQMAIPFLVVLSTPLSDRGYVAIGFSMMMAFYLPMSPINTITQNFLSKNSYILKYRTFFVPTVIAVGMLSLCYYALVPVINAFYFDNDDFKKVLYDFLVFMPFYFFYMLSRTLVDVRFSRAYLSQIAAVALLVYLALVLFDIVAIYSAAVAYAFMCGIVVKILSKEEA